jgi:hypothetical protein
MQQTICWIVVSHKTSTRYPVLFCSQNASPLLSKACRLLVVLLMFLQSTPKLWTTCLLLLVLLDVAKTQTLSLTMTMDEDFWPPKWFVKPHFRFSMTPWFSFNFFKSCKYFGTHFHNTKFAKTFWTNIPLKKIEFSFKN